MLDIKKLQDFLDSEEGQESMDRMVNKWAKEDNFKKRWKKKFKKFLENRTDDELNTLFDKFHVHAEKRRDILWNQKYDGETSLYPHLHNAISKLGKKAKKSCYNIFTTSMYIWRGFQSESYCGQGYFHSISKV